MNCLRTDDGQMATERSHSICSSGAFGSGVLFWLVGCFGFNVPLRQYFSLYPKKREMERKDR